MPAPLSSWRHMDVFLNSRTLRGWGSSAGVTNIHSRHSTLIGVGLKNNVKVLMHQACTVHLFFKQIKKT